MRVSKNILHKLWSIFKTWNTFRGPYLSFVNFGDCHFFGISWVKYNMRTQISFFKKHSIIYWAAGEFTIFLSIPQPTNYQIGRYKVSNCPKILFKRTTNFHSLFPKLPNFSLVQISSKTQVTFDFFKYFFFHFGGFKFLKLH